VPIVFALTTTPHRFRCAGGCSFAVDPTLDARDATPDWMDNEHLLVRIIALEESSTDIAPFGFWKLSGRKALTHDGANLRVCLRTARDAFHLQIDHKLSDGQRFGYALPAGGRLREGQQTLARFAALCENKHSRNQSVTVNRRSRSALHHLHALQALDGLSCGASQRDIADVLMGEEVAAAEWSPDSALRAQVRATIHRARRLMNGGYRALLAQNNRHGQGGIQ